MYSKILFSLTAMLMISGCASDMQQKEFSTLTISAASSLSSVMKDLKHTFQEKNHIQLHINTAASGTLASQIHQGAPVDIFMSASERFFNNVDKKGHIHKAYSRPFLTNQMVLIVPKRSPLGLKNWQQLTHSGVKHLAIGEPETVPAGKYAQEILRFKKLWQPLKERMIYGKNVRQVLTFVETGNAEAGIVYHSDALISENVKIIQKADPRSHSKIKYYAGILKRTDDLKAAQKFYQFLQTKPAEKIFIQHGFTILSKE